MLEAECRNKTIQLSHVHAGPLQGFQLSALHLVPASTKVHRARSVIPPAVSTPSTPPEVRNRGYSSQRQRKLNSRRHKHCQFLSEELNTNSTGRIAMKRMCGNGPYSALFTPTNLAAALPQAVDYTLCVIVLPTIPFPCSTWLYAEVCSLTPSCHQPSSQTSHDCTKWRG